MALEEAVKLYDQGKDLWDAQKYKAAAQKLTQAAQTTEQQSENKPLTAKGEELEEFLLEIRDWCAMAMHMAGDYRDAVACNRRNLAARLRSSDYGPSHGDTLDNRRRLAENYSVLGQYDHAIAECRSILTIVDDSQDRNTLAQSLFRKGDERSMKEAVNINLYTLKRDEAKTGKSDFALCKARHNLGVELCELKKFDESRNYLSENITILHRSSRSDWADERSRLLHDSREALARCVEIESLHHTSKTREEDRKAKILAALERERERVELERRKETKRLEQERLEKRRLEEQSLATERLHRERLESEHREKIRLQEELKEKERQDKERETTQRKAKERRDREQKEQERKEQKKKEEEEKVQNEELLDHGKQHFQKQPSQDSNDRKRYAGSPQQRQEIPGQLEANSNKPSTSSSPVVPISPEHRHKRTISDPSLLGPKAARSTRSGTTSSLKDGKSSLLPPLAENKSTTTGRRKSTSDITSLNPDTRSITSHVKLNTAKESAHDLPAELTASTRSSRSREQDSQKRRASPSSARSKSGSASYTETQTTNIKNQRSSERPASVLENHWAMPGSWPGDFKDDMSVGKRAQQDHQSDSIPRITRNSPDTREGPRITHSKQSLRGNSTEASAPEVELTRASSVNYKQRPSSVNGRLFDSPDPNSPGTRADLWFENLGDTSHRFLDTYKDYVFDDQRSSYKRVKVAVLDTGVANSSRFGAPKIIRISKSRITWCKVAGNTLEPRDDEDGHGTQVASIILQVTPYAKLYVYRIVRNRAQSISRKGVAAAIEDAILKHDVDIINMSFGWDHEYGEGHDELRAALRRCNDKDVLVFAATSNDDIASVSGMAYPARADNVIAIDAATSKGEWLSSNPTRDNEYKTHRFTALGEAIKTDADHPDPRMNGTSAASPVAAGIAALILEFARQPPLGYDPNIAKMLKRSDAMREILAGAVSVKHTRNGEYRHLVPGKLFKCDSISGDAGEWFSLLSRRHDAVESVGRILKTKYGHEILHPVNQRIQQHWSRGGSK